MRGARALGRRVARAFLGPCTVLGRLALGPGPISALRLGRLARGTEPGPMVPTAIIPIALFFFFMETNSIVIYIYVFNKIYVLLNFKMNDGHICLADCITTHIII